MPGKCPHPTCFPDETGCDVEGKFNVIDCPNYNKVESTDRNEALDPFDEMYRIPWTGNSFGLIDLNFLTASAKPILIGITGVASAGKTTFLASLYCLLRQGRKIGDYSFAGSLTLVGWEDIAWYLSWKDSGNIQFPPHTANDAGRIPGLLHIALQNSSGKKIHLVFTDAPGEWFDYWRNNTHSENAKGAKWISDHADAFLLFADCEMLAGQKRGQGKSQINSVADRLLENLGSRPLGLIWSKSDIEITPSTKTQILQKINHNPSINFSQFSTSVTEGSDGTFHANICESVNWIIEKISIQLNTRPEISLKTDDLFLSMGTRNG